MIFASLLVENSYYSIGAASLAIVVVLLLAFSRRTHPNAPPVVTSSFPLFGVLIEFFRSPNTMVKRCYKDYGSVFTIPLFHKRLTFLIGPEAQELFFKAPDDVLSQQEVYDFMKPVFGPDVVYDASKAKRHVQFSTMATGLRTNRLKGYVQKIEEETRAYLQKEWNSTSGTADLLTTLSEITILTASRCLHGDDVRAHMFKELQALYHDLDAGLAPYSVFWPTAPTTLHKKRDQARLDMCALFSKVIRERREATAANMQSDGTDILSLFMDITYKDGTPISDAEITGLLIALLFAGQHTSCITSTWTAMFIMNNPDLLARMQAEQDSVANKQQSLDYEAVNNMGFLHNCMREALRLCPTFIMILRRAEQDITIKTGKSQTHVIPKGDFVVVSPTVSMRLASTFPNPDTFDPDRYTAPREEHKIPYAYLGFGGGMHSCMGQSFGFLQIKTILSVLFREYELKRPNGKSMPEIDYEAIVVGPKGDCTVEYTKRQSS